MENHFVNLQALDGNSWGQADFAEKITVLSFTDQKSQDISAKVGSALGKRFLENERFQIATAVKVPSMFKGLAGALLKAGQAKARESAARKFKKQGKIAPAGINERIHVLFDIDGKCSQEVLSEWVNGQARLLLVDENGDILGQSCHEDPEKAVEALTGDIAAALG